MQYSRNSMTLIQAVKTLNEVRGSYSSVCVSQWCGEDSKANVVWHWPKESKKENQSYSQAYCYFELKADPNGRVNHCINAIKF